MNARAESTLDDSSPTGADVGVGARSSGRSVCPERCAAIQCEMLNAELVELSSLLH